MELIADSATPPVFTVVDLAQLDPAQTRALQASGFGPFSVRQFGDAAAALGEPKAFDAVLVRADSLGEAVERVASMAEDTATLVVALDIDPASLLRWLELGAQDILAPGDLDAASLGLRVRAAIERKRIEREGRKSYATDLDTGLPHQQQLMEHMSHLLALREREPSPMAVLVLRVEGLATVEARLGREAANVLRRKAGVRLRAGVRASDVVAALAEDSFAVLLGAMLLPADAARVGAKLLTALTEPFKVSGRDVVLAGALGIAQYPEDGAQPEMLLRRALGLAASTAAQGRLGHSNFADSGGLPPPAANDE